jgi:hypothetical protein
MALHTVTAHLEANHICLDKQVDLDPDGKLWVTYSTPDEDDSFREDWSRLGLYAMGALLDRDEKMAEAERNGKSYSDPLT